MEITDFWKKMSIITELIIDRLFLKSECKSVFEKMF